MTRNRTTINSQFPELVEALTKNPSQCFIADGELVAFHQGLTSFQKLQPRIQRKTANSTNKAKNIKVYLYIFDLLYAENFDLRKLPLRTRKKILKKYLTFKTPINYLPHRNQISLTYYQKACKKGWEGILAKNALSSYQSSRSKHWLKFKCVNEQEFVIGGYTAPQGKRFGFGALLIGYYEKQKLQYAGKVGTGYDEALLKELYQKLSALTIKSSPFKEPIQEPATFVQPKLVCQIAFSEWTNDGKLRHPRFVGLRKDKNPKEVAKETAI